jgi:hypothetical protein
MPAETPGLSGIDRQSAMSATLLMSFALKRGR